MRRSTKVLHWFYKLSWKKLMGISVLVLILLAGPLILESALNPTRTRSEAALLQKTAPVTNEFVTPTGPPKIFLVDHFFGKVGDAVLIHGEQLGGLHENSWVSLAGKKIGVENLVTWTSDFIEFIVPEGFSSGAVEISILGKRTRWDGIFFVTDVSTEAELSLKPTENVNVAQMLAKDIKNGKELLVWFLIINGDGELTIKPNNGVTIQEKIYDFSVGRVYEAKIKLNSQVTAKSTLQLVSLLTVQKTDDQSVGIARGELAIDGGLLTPLQLNPLYVSF